MPRVKIFESFKTELHNEKHYQHVIFSHRPAVRASGDIRDIVL